MTNFTEHSPSGKILKDPANRKFIINIPSYVNPNFDDKANDKAVKKYNGEQSIGYKVFIGAEIIQDGISALDVQRIRDLCYLHDKQGNIDEKRTIKEIEIDKNNFNKYRALLITDRPANADKLLIASDVGNTGGTTEIIVMAQIGSKWSWLYNITLRSLPSKEQYYIFKYLTKRLQADKVGIDCTDSTGRDIYRDMESDVEIDKNKLTWVGFNENIEVGVELDEKGQAVRENGKPVKRFENTTLWSVSRLCHLFYEPEVILPYSHKLDEQLDCVIAISRGNSVSYQCASPEDHLWQAFQVFAIMQWYIEYEGYSKAGSNESFRQKHCNPGA
jgi:hypothetical protein